MAVTKILARRAPVKALIDYALNGEKTGEQVLTASQNCTTAFAARQMARTKEQFHQTGGVQCYHIIQSFKPGEVTPEQALEIAKTFAREHLSEHEVVIGTHVDRHHIHSHIVFNSVNAMTGKKYHSSPQNYYQQIRSVSDQLCREHGLSVVMQGEEKAAKSYIEWLRESRGQPTYRSMLEADLRESMEDANDLGHFFLIMEHKGYEICHGNRLGFRLRGQKRFMYPERKNPLFSETAIKAAIEGNLAEIEAGHRPAVVYRPAYRPPRRRTRFKGLVGLYYHYVHLLGLVQRRQYPPRMAAQTKQDVMRFERFKEQFAFLREHDLTTPTEVRRFIEQAEGEITELEQQRMLINVEKKKRKALYDALGDTEALAPARALYAEGMTGFETEYRQYLRAVEVLKRCGVSIEALTAQKAEDYRVLAEINLKLKEKRRERKLAKGILAGYEVVEREVQRVDERKQGREAEVEKP